MMSDQVEETSLTAVAESFSRAAHDYARYASVQQRIAEDALTYVPASVAGMALDIGCGPGQHTATLATRCQQATGVDIAPGMLTLARQQFPQCQFMWGDAHQLPVASQSIALLFSSMALQWCRSPAPVLAECRRVLKPGGEGVLAIMVAGSLWQLVQAQRAAGLANTVNALPSATHWTEAAQGYDWTVTATINTYEDIHTDFASLLHSIGKIGAAVGASQQARLTKQGYLRLRQCYQQYALSATHWPIHYQVLFLHLKG